MITKHITMSYRHVLAEDVEYDYYSPSVMRAGLVFTLTKYPVKNDWYKITCGHGAHIPVPASKVKLVRVTRTVIVEEEDVL